MRNHMLLGIFAAGVAMLVVADPTPIQGGDRHFSKSISIDNSCDVNVDYFKIDGNEITLKNTSGEKLVFAGTDLYHEGDQVYLDQHQQRLVRQYKDGIDLLVDDVVDIASEGVDIGTTVALEAAQLILGHGDSDLIEVEEMIANVSAKVSAKLKSRQFDSEQSVDEFEHEIKAEVKAVVEKVMPRIAAKMMALSMSGDEEAIREIETKAKMIEHQVETFLEPRIEALEAKAEGLCGRIVALDIIEDQLQHDGLTMIDVIEAD